MKKEPTVWTERAPTRRVYPVLSEEQVCALAKVTTTDSVWEHEAPQPNFFPSDCLSGKAYHFTFDTGRTASYTFTDAHTLTWSIDGSDPRTDRYFAHPFPTHPELVCVLHYKAGFALPMAENFVLDLQSGAVVSIDAQVGGYPGKPNFTTYEVYFGQAEGFAEDPDAFVPCYTRELVGKAVYWSGVPLAERDMSFPPIKYCFTSPQYMTYTHLFRNEGSVWMTSTPARYIKLKPGMYWMPVVESSQGGFLLTMLMDLDAMRDMQTGFGLSVSGEPHVEAIFHSSRYGAYTTMESFF